MSEIVNMDLIVKTSVANLYSKPSFTSEMVSQALMWELSKILDKKDNWYKIRQWDQYESWTHKFYTTEINPDVLSSKYTIHNRLEWVYSKPNNQSSIIGEVLFGTEIPLVEKNGNWLTIQFPNKKTGYINVQNVTFDGDLRKRIISISKNFLGIPYLWGGKTSKGFDCSGFVQTVFKFCGINFERDSSQQILNPDLIETGFIDANPGDIVFFKTDKDVDHVAIALGENNIIHCSGEVKIDSLDSNNPNCNQELLQNYYKTFSIKDLLIGD